MATANSDQLNLIRRTTVGDCASQLEESSDALVAVGLNKESVESLVVVIVVGEIVRVVQQIAQSSIPSRLG